MKALPAVAIVLALVALLPVLVIQRAKLDAQKGEMAALAAENTRLQQAGWDTAQGFVMSTQQFDEACFAKHWW